MAIMAADKTKPNPEDDIDFGIDVGTLSEAEKAIYDKLNAQMRKAYLGKTSDLAKLRTEVMSEKEKIAADLAAAQSDLVKWNEWYQREGQYLTPRQQAAAMEEEGLEKPDVYRSEIQALRKEFQDAATKYNEVLTKLKMDNEAMQQAFTLHDQLVMLQMKHPDLDRDKVLSTAKDRKIQDLDLAYQLAYGDELRAKSVEEEVSKRLEEERTKIAAEKEVVDMKPSTVRYAPPQEAKSYGQAGQNLLASVRKSGGGGMITD